MEVFVRNVPIHATNKQLEKLIDGHLRQCGVSSYHVDKMRGKPLATITVLEVGACLDFLKQFGVPQGAARYASSLRPLQLNGQRLHFSISRNQPSDITIRSLRYEAETKEDRAVKSSEVVKTKRVTSFAIKDVRCGTWDYHGENLTFVNHCETASKGTIMFGQREARILLDNPNADQIRVDAKYYDCEHIVLGDFDDPTITIALDGILPKFYQINDQGVLSTKMTALVLGPAAAQSKDVKKIRLTSIDEAHGRVAGVCFVYRVTLTDRTALGMVKRLLDSSVKMVSTISMSTTVMAPVVAWQRGKLRLDHELTDARRFGGKPFSVRYQLDRLARNGCISPSKLLLLLPAVAEVIDQCGIDATVGALRCFYRQVPRPGPEVEARECSIRAMRTLIRKYADAYDQYEPGNLYELAKAYMHINLIHKVVITPAGTYLEGPSAEPTNRVLRKYATQTDCFIRVVFQDEDGSSMHHDPRASQEAIYHIRYKGVLDGTINIAGQGFSFLGFSHSSLRNRSCWFMAPLIDSRTRTLVLSPQVIKELGDFTHIRTPAKCAARIGQCFTDTTASVSVKDWEVGKLPVVERNGRDFSDGVGTLSRQLFEDVWQVYGMRNALKPTVLQIRFQGAKGMVSLDSRLQGRQLLLRTNMEKFVGSQSRVLEICGAGFRPLPMVLNRQSVQILEDLGTPTEAVLSLQTREVQKLQCMLESAVNTASLLETMELTKAAKLPDLIDMLDQARLDFRHDRFLTGIAQMAVVHQLRDIKYRGRIHINDGVTLYGIMDETGYLQEGEVYVVTEKAPDGGRKELIRNNILITRSPAMHPGDIQQVNAVSVPADSPLKHLSNVVVFSQHGARDLPSQLSGGDLDGDLYNIIWDSTLWPTKFATPADYPRVKPVELDRIVTGKDMSDFFVTFMETNQLGMICSIHMQLADQRPMGTWDPDCIKLAAMASTAVDYSKTGIPVDMKQCPKYDRCRPDFMAPSPRILLSEQGYLDLEDELSRPYRYYKSQKALGQLYRAIDERSFIADLQAQQRAVTATHERSSSPLNSLLHYMKKWANQYGIGYSHQTKLARDIRASYEESLLDAMYHYSPVAHSVLSEQEVYAGIILGRQSGAQNKSLRELAKEMRERFGSVVEYTELQIVKGEGALIAADLESLGYDEREIEALPRAIACLEVAVLEPGRVDRKAGELKSFG
ncbi:hypothetical protein BAUCODRAFT_119665 [Baudoinia panamericana UAMH 10762]|uniref:RNA-dependent RNA polymerase n=1 Tax=Baudoinia panamericana (strain UAMH 10762) TaxID=717646 RepID=M2LZJ3_BAUPA|nr:uncharacterized protein BAUCODRAFT_119665 [Baudoinia panamericana UAMH 10762]EMD00113.1 hypothetical protein BAUCODRAFT_119665 [Baudoinia panamericana UAMH 10762]